MSGTVNTDGSFNPDAFAFEVASGHELSSLSFTNLTGLTHFFAISDGVLDQGDAAGTGNLVSTLVSSPDDVGVNILDGSLNSFGGSGITNPLSSGTYNVWLQETIGSTVVEYTISLQTSAVPEPTGVTATLLGGLLLLGFCRRRQTARKRSA